MILRSIFLLYISAAIASGEPFSNDNLLQTKTVKKLLNFQPNQKTRKMSIKKRQSAKKGEYLSTRVVNEGFLALGENEWIYMVTVPSKQHKHDEEGLTLAIDQNGTIYENRAHVCGGIVHFSAKKIPENSQSFFSTFIDSDGEKKWIRYKVK